MNTECYLEANWVKPLLFYLVKYNVRSLITFFFITSHFFQWMICIPAMWGTLAEKNKSELTKQEVFPNYLDWWRELENRDKENPQKDYFVNHFVCWAWDVPTVLTSAINFLKIQGNGDGVPPKGRYPSAHSLHLRKVSLCLPSVRVSALASFEIEGNLVKCSPIFCFLVLAK